jgi:cyanophycinase-like exopeptidase
MMLGHATLSVRAMRQGQGPRWRAALAVAGAIAVMPHFDRMRGFMGPEAFRQALDAAPGQITLIGVDEDTALVRQSDQHWVVSGRQTVSVFDKTGTATIYHPGQRVPATWA